MSSCPHPSGSCSCERVVINYTIPKSSECACPSERAQPTATVAGNSRIQKNRRRSTVVNTSSLEKAIRAGQDAETDTSSVMHTPTEESRSNEGSPPSSASSTPRILPAQNKGVSSCCQPKQAPPQVQKGSCCSSKSKSTPEPMPVKSCCSGPKLQSKVPPPAQSAAYQHFGQQFQYQPQAHIQASHYPNFQTHTSPPQALPFGLGAPIYNHAAAAYHQPASIPMSPGINHPISTHGGTTITQHVPEHNCHCGESCSCFGCAAHPNNATMMEYVRLMAEFQYTGGFGTVPPPLYDMPTYPHHPGFGAEASQSMPFNAMPQGMASVTTAQLNFQAVMNLPILPNASMPFSGSWQPSPLPATSIPSAQYAEPSKYVILSPAEPQTPLKSEDSVTTPIANSPSDSKDEETTTLSPSSYFWNQMTLPGCNDATGTCQCGDGCACVGCLTHGGHNGLHLDAPAIGEHETFPEFSTEAGLHLDDPSSFMDFSANQT